MHTHRAVSTVTCSGLYPEKVLFLKFRNIPWEGVVFSSSGIYPEMFRNIPWERVSSVEKYTLRRCFPSSGLYPENVFTLFRNIPWEGVSPVQEYTLSRGFPYSGLYPKKVIPQFRNIPWAGVFLIQEYTLRRCCFSSLRIYHKNVFPLFRNIPWEEGTNINIQIHSFSYCFILSVDCCVFVQQRCLTINFSLFYT